MLAAAYHSVDRVRDQLRSGQVRDREAGPSTGPMLRSATPPLVAQEHAAWVIPAEQVSAMARDAAAIAAPASKDRRAGLPVHPREISFTAARRAILR